MTYEIIKTITNANPTSGGYFTRTYGPRSDGHSGGGQSTEFAAPSWRTLQKIHQEDRNGDGLSFYRLFFMVDKITVEIEDLLKVQRIGWPSEAGVPLDLFFQLLSEEELVQAKAFIEAKAARKAAVAEKNAAGLREMADRKRALLDARKRDQQAISEKAAPGKAVASALAEQETVLRQQCRKIILDYVQEFGEEEGLPLGQEEAEALFQAQASEALKALVAERDQADKKAGLGLVRMLEKRLADWFGQEVGDLLRNNFWELSLANKGNPDKGPRWSMEEAHRLALLGKGFEAPRPKPKLKK